MRLQNPLHFSTLAVGIIFIALLGCSTGSPLVRTPTPDIPSTVEAQLQATLVVIATETPTPDVPVLLDNKVNQELVDRDREALVALYNATNGPEWVNNWNWLSDKPLDEWNGVTTDDSGQVVEINFGCTGGNNLRGYIPPELGNLSELSILALGCNDLIGSVPPETGNLTNLTVFTIHRNKLTGELPHTLNKLSKMHQFNWYQDTFEDNELCAPLSPIQDWLREIEYEFGGSTCPQK